MIKRHRNVAHLWADKQVIRFFRKNFEKKHYKNFRSVYLALCEIDSDFGEGKEIGGFTKTVGTYAGLGKDITSLYLRSLRDAGIINYQQDTKEGGQFGKTRLTIYKWEKSSDNLVSKLRKALVKNHYLKIPSTENPPSGKSAQPKITPYKNTNKLVNISKNSFSKEKESERKARSLNPEKILHTTHKEEISGNSKDHFPAEVLEDISADSSDPNIPSNNKIFETNPNIPDQSQIPGKPEINPVSEGDSVISQTTISDSLNNIGMKLVELFCEERNVCFSDVPSPDGKRKKGWAIIMNKIMERGYKSDVIADVIRFIFNSEDPFWRGRVASPGQLWENIDTVAQQMAAKTQKDKKKAEGKKSREFLLK